MIGLPESQRKPLPQEAGRVDPETNQETLPGLLTLNDLKIDLIKRLRKAVLGLGLKSEAVTEVMGREMFGPDITLAEVRELYSHLLLTVAGKIMGGDAQSNPMKTLMEGEKSENESDRVIEQAQKKMGRLMGMGHHELTDLIEKIETVENGIAQMQKPDKK